MIFKEKDKYLIDSLANLISINKNYDEDFKAFLTNKNFSDEMKRDVTELLSTTLTKQQIAAKTGSNLVQRIQSGDGYAEAERDADMQITENVYGSGPELVQRIQSGDGYAEAERDANMQITENVYGSGGEQGDSPTKSSVLITKWLKDNPDKSSEEAPLETVDTTVDNLFSDAIEALENKKFDVEKFKGEIDALLPTVEEDPEMEGALITMLGAAIMSGTDPNWVVNLGKGIERAMPAFINYRTKQKEKINARDMSIAKMAIKTKNVVLKLAYLRQARLTKELWQKKVAQWVTTWLPKRPHFQEQLLIQKQKKTVLLRFLSILK